jgi:hypothetical protein
VHHVDRIIEAPAGIVWRILIDTREWPRWGPDLWSKPTRHPIALQRLVVEPRLHKGWKHPPARHNMKMTRFTLDAV